MIVRKARGGVSFLESRPRDGGACQLLLVSADVLFFFGVLFAFVGVVQYNIFHVRERQRDNRTH